MLISTKLPNSLALAVTLALAAFALTSAPALAAPRASHAFSKHIGAPGEAAGDLSEPAGVAVNESKGLLYVADVGNDRVDEFETNGKFVRAWGGGVADGASAFEACTSTCRKGVSGTNPGEFERPESIAVDNDSGSPSFGDVYVADGGSHGVIDKFSATGAYINQVTETGPWSEAGGHLAHGPGGPLGGPVRKEFSGGGNEQTVVGLGVAVGSNGGLWVDQRLENATGLISNFSNAHQNAYMASRLDGSELGGFAVDSSEDFYASAGIGEGIAKFNADGLLLIDGFDTEPSTGLAVESPTESSPGSLYVDNVDSIARFSPEGVLGERFGAERELSDGTGLAVNSATGEVYVAEGATGVVDLYANTPGKPGVEEEAFANVSALNATLSAEVNTYGLPTTYTIEYGTTSTYGLVAKTGTIPGSYNGAVAVSATLEGKLQPETTYHFRVLAHNTDGTELGTDITFTTLGDLAGLPDGRGFEMVSPVANADGNVYTPETGITCECTVTSPMRAAADGDAVEYVADAQATGGTGNNGANHGDQYVAMRASGAGWSPVDLETSGLDKAPFEALFSSELSNGGTSAVPTGSDMLSVVEGKLYESRGGRLSSVAVLPDEKAASSASFGGAGDVSHVISTDGSRVFWTDTEVGANQGQIFVREDGDRTVAVSLGAAQFWTASPDGRYAFYTEGESLWRFDVDGETRENLSGEGAGVLGVIGVNETGEAGAYVYFVANGVLGDGTAQGAVAGTCRVTPEGGEGLCNMYVLHDGVVTFIAVLDGLDLAGSGTVEGGTGVAALDLGQRTAEVTPNGQNLVFRSRASLTGYDNKGGCLDPEGHAAGCPEVYTYDADTQELSCVSCNPTGAPPVGGSSVSLPLSFSGSFMHRWISEDGARVFFESNEALVLQDTNRTTDVYEWERDGSGSCQNVKGCIYLLSGGASTASSYLLDVSASGDDVFIISRAQLTSQDKGDTYELYDARVGVTEPPTGQACAGTGCQGLPAAPAPFATPSSVTFNGIGNFPAGTATNVPAVKPPIKKAAKCPKGKTRNKKGQCIRKKRSKAKNASRPTNDRRAK
jgi:hypothetical protein